MPAARRFKSAGLKADKVRVHPPLDSTAKNQSEREPDRDMYYNAIAKKAVEYIGDNDTVYICAASVGYLMTRYLPENIRFTAVTNSIIVAEELLSRKNIETFVIGGKLRSRGYMADAMSVDYVRNMRFDVGFMSAMGLTAGFGLSNTINESAAFQRAVVECSRRNICLMPGYKLGFEGFAKVVDLERFDILITDWDAPQSEIASITSSGVEVVIAEKPS